MFLQNPRSMSPVKMRLTFSRSIILFCGLAPSVLSSLTPAATPVTEPAFQPESGGRGTVSLITSCVVILLLAVYTAIHLNINPSRRQWERFIEKIGWMLIATVAPELVIWIAIGQWETASKLIKLIKNETLNVTSQIDGH
jgi:hypothetical protein